MNRPIKFRGKSVVSGKMIYGNFKEEYGVFWIGMNSRWEEIEKETLGQYIGLDDKNKVEIYGGDVIQYDDYKGTVKWEDMGFKIKNEFVDPESDRYQTHRHDKNYKLQRYFPEHTEVIGNIYSNPELIT